MRGYTVRFCPALDAVKHVLEDPALQIYNAPGDSGGTPTLFADSHIHLGSRQRSIKVPSYEEDLEAELGFYGFGDSLAKFIRDYTPIEVYGSDFDGDGFEGHEHCINWCKVRFSYPSASFYQLDNRSSLIVVRATLPYCSQRDSASYLARLVPLVTSGRLILDC